MELEKTVKDNGYEKAKKVKSFNFSTSVILYYDCIIFNIYSSVYSLYTINKNAVINEGPLGVEYNLLRIKKLKKAKSIYSTVNINKT